MSYHYQDAQIVKKQVELLIKQYPEIEEDATLLADMIEGETDLHRVLQKCISFVQDAKTMASAIKERESNLKARRARFERQEESGRKIIQTLMECSHQEKITLPEATLSLTKPREKVNVIDVDQLPQGYFEVERKPKIKEISSALKAGEKLPGAELTLGDTGLTIRSK